MGTGGTGDFGRRPLAQEDAWSASGVFDREIPDGEGVVALKPIMRLVTLLAVADIAMDLFISDEGTSSTGDAKGFSPEEVFFPKPNFHFDAFLVTTGGAWITGTGGISVESKGKSPRCFDDERDALLISRAKACEAVASVSNVSSMSEPGRCG